MSPISRRSAGIEASRDLNMKSLGIRRGADIEIEIPQLDIVAQTAGTIRAVSRHLQQHPEHEQHFNLWITGEEPALGYDVAHGAAGDLLGREIAEISNPDDVVIYARNIIRVAGPFE